MHNTNYTLVCRTNKHNFTVTVCISVHVTGYRAMIIECIVFVQWLLSWNSETSKGHRGWLVDVNWKVEMKHWLLMTGRLWVQ